MCGDDGHDGHGHHLFLTLFPPDGFGATGDMPELSALFDVDYGKCITRWQSTPALCAGGLRAPPATLC